MFNQLIKDLDLGSYQYYTNYELLADKLIIKAIDSASDVFLIREIVKIDEQIDKDIFDFFCYETIIEIRCKATNL